MENHSHRHAHAFAFYGIGRLAREVDAAQAVIAALRPEQLEENAAASGAEVDPALFAEAERIVAAAMPRFE